jgi:hypothetical protein
MGVECDDSSESIGMNTSGTQKNTSLSLFARAQEKRKKQEVAACGRAAGCCRVRWKGLKALSSSGLFGVWMDDSPGVLLDELSTSGGSERKWG